MVAFIIITSITTRIFVNTESNDGGGLEINQGHTGEIALEKIGSNALKPVHRIGTKEGAPTRAIRCMKILIF